MPKIYPNFSRWLLPLYLLNCCLDADAQQSPSPDVHFRTATDQISFIAHAPVLLPALLKQRQYESIGNFLTNWRNAEYPSLELIFSAEALLAIETGRFSSYYLPCDCLIYLSDYARELKNATTQGGKFRYYLQLEYPYRYDATEEARMTLLFIQTWARNLEAKPGLDKDELFICHTLAGDIADPATVVQTDPGSCPRLSHTWQYFNAYNNAVFTARRNTKKGTAAVLVGWWIPTGKLRQVLGTHPSIGVQLGVRNKLNEYDLTWCFRFGNPTPQPYTFIRNDTPYTSNYYDGGYIGLEYTRYLVHRKYLDFGFISGIAYDYFSVANGWGNDPDIAHLEPFNVGSFDWNNGLRVKYFLKRRAYVGLTAKYHLIHYDNSGGTNIDGNAYTVDLSFGSH